MPQLQGTGLTPSVRGAELAFEAQWKNPLLFLGSFSKPNNLKYYRKYVCFLLWCYSSRELTWTVCRSSQLSVAVRWDCVVAVGCFFIVVILLFL